MPRRRMGMGTRLEDQGATSTPSLACCPQRAMEHLEDLSRVHEELLAALACKRDVTREMSPDPIAICRVRWNVSRASRNHRTVVAPILGELQIGAGTGRLVVISSLHDEGVQQTQRYTRHIQDWTPDRVMTSWRDFCAASARIQADIEQRIETESRLIGRMLRSRACG